MVTPILATPSLNRYERAKERTKPKLEMDVSDTPDIYQPQQEPTHIIASSQTDIESRHIQGLLVEVDSLRAENDILRASSLNQRFSLESFRDCDSKVNNFTGLSTFATFNVLFGYLKPFIPSMASLDGFQVLMMTLMRLRLNLPVMFLAHEFGIPQATVSRIFSSVIDIMFYRMKPFIHWPERETLEKSMPMQFRKHFGKKCMVIIDCFEVFIERPSSVEARAETWSSYKHHNTVKFLIGITPQGSISFISKAWGGRVSDKYITEHCGFLNKILPGDLILADHGFDIKESVGSCAAKVHIPAFTKGRNQLSAADVEETRKLANVRIHVERVIGTVRQKYSILNSIVPIRFIMGKDSNNFTMLDKIALICCALVNLNDSVVAFD